MTNTTRIDTGVIAPDLGINDQDSNKVSLSDYKGKWVVVYFYPKDDTPGCTLEAVDFTLKAGQFRGLNAEIIGISPDTVKSHCNFIDKHKLNIRLLSDPDHSVLEAYGVWQIKKLYGKEYPGVVRSTFLIDPTGKIAHIWPNVKAKGHADKVYEKLKELTEEKK